MQYNRAILARKGTKSLAFFFFLMIQVYFLIFLAALGLCCCARAFSSCGEQGLLFVAECGLLIAGASLVAERGLQARWLQQLQHVDSVVAVCGLSSCGAGAQLLRGMWDLPGRARTRVPCIGRWILNHCAIREVPHLLFVFLIKGVMVINNFIMTSSFLTFVHQEAFQFFFFSLLSVNPVNQWPETTDPFFSVYVCFGSLPRRLGASFSLPLLPFQFQAIM